MTTILSPSPADIVAALDDASTRHVTNHGSKVIWRVWGDGYPLVLMHGGSGSWMHWVRNIEGLARDFMLIVPDLPGFGDSDEPPKPLSADAMALSLRHGLDTILGPDRRFAIAAFSMGGVLGGHLARHCADRVETLVLIGTAGLLLRRAPMERLHSWRRLGTEAEKLAAHRRNLEILMLHDPAKIDDLAVHVQMQSVSRAKLRGPDVAASGTLRPCLAAMACRVATIWGEQDPTAAPYFDERKALLDELRPDASFEVFPGIGHWLQYEAPDLFNRHLPTLVRP